MTVNTPIELQTIKNPFHYASFEINTAVDEHGVVWCCAKDVFTALDIAWRGTKSLQKVPEKWQALRNLRTSFGEKETYFINEAAVYMVTLRSNKSEAQRFTEWVCEEVLPAIRRQGFFGSITAGQQIQLRNQMFKLLDKLNTTDAFIHTKLMASLRNICNQLGEPMPDVALLGQDRNQLSLGV